MPNIYRVNIDNLKDVIREVEPVSGLYAFLNQDGYYLYIGQSINLRARIRAHSVRWLKQLITNHGARQIMTVEFEQKELDEAEQNAIDLYAPRFNKQHAQDGVMMEINLTIPRNIMDQLQDVSANRELSIDDMLREFIKETIKRKNNNHNLVGVVQ